MSTLLSRMFARPRALCAECQVGQGRRCACRARRQRRREIPLPVLQVLIYGGSVALVVCLVVWLWRALS